MALEGYKEVRKGVYESDEFFIRRPKIDDDAIRQILEKQRNYRPSAPAGSSGNIRTWDSNTATQESNERTGA